MVIFCQCNLSFLNTVAVKKMLVRIAGGLVFTLLTAFAQAAPAQIVPITGNGAAPVPTGNLLSPVSLYTHADVVVKSVILLLLFSSLLSWSVWLAKMLEISSRARRLKHSLAELSSASSLHDVGEINHPACKAMNTIAQNELLQATRKSYRVPVDSIKERASILIQRVESKETSYLNRGASILATTGAVAPFVGLFGTVWGIMHSFVSIAQMQTTNLSVVAPGIAEALFATALGLVSAIPAVILYNIISRRIANYRVLLSDSSSVVMCLLSHNLDELKHNTNPLANVA